MEQPNVSKKRRRAEEDEDHTFSKIARHTSISSLSLEEQTDLNNPAWELQKLQTPTDFYNFVKNNWRPKTVTDPHKNLTFRFNPTSLRTGFTLPGDNNTYIHSARIYTDRIRIIHNSLWKTSGEILSLQQNSRNGKKKAKLRLKHLNNYRSKLRNELTKLDYAKYSADCVYHLYYNPVSGKNANNITTKQKSEVEHMMKIFNSLKSFYAHPS